MRICLIATIRKSINGKIIRYRLIDIDSGEIKEVNRNLLIKAVKSKGWAFRNVAIETNNYTDELTTRERLEEIPIVDTAGKLLSKTKYVVVSVDEIKASITLAEFSGEMIELDVDKIYKYATEMASKPNDYKHEKWKIKETPTDEERAILLKIDKLYNTFILKTRAIGLDCSFEYLIAKNDVILKSYIGISKHAIIPNFITVIANEAFYNKGITILSLNDGLETIRQYAFAINDIVEVIDKKAFYGNTQLFKTTKQKDKIVEELDITKFRVHSKDIKIANQSKMD